MGKKRYVDTIFWRDEYSAGLDPSEKLLFLYLLTNTDTNICGIYQLPLKTMSADTGFEKEMVLTILGRFEKDEKVLYRNGWVAIKNFIKHQNEQSPKVQIGINNELKNVPKELKEWIGKGIDTLSHSDSDLDSDSDLNSDSKGTTQARTIFEAWNACENLQHHTKLEAHRDAIKTALNKYELAEIVAAINKYSHVKDLEGSLFAYSWILKDFLRRGLDRFVGDLPDIEYIQYQRREQYQENPVVKYHREKRERENASA